MFVKTMSPSNVLRTRPTLAQRGRNRWSGFESLGESFFFFFGGGVGEGKGDISGKNVANSEAF